MNKVLSVQKLDSETLKKNANSELSIKSIMHIQMKEKKS